MMLRGVDLNKYKLLEHILKAYWILYHVSSSLRRQLELLNLIFIQGISAFYSRPAKIITLH
jgi:hypothetical protein